MQPGEAIEDWFEEEISIHAPYKGCNGDLYLNLSISNENRLKLLLFLRK